MSNFGNYFVPSLGEKLRISDKNIPQRRGNKQVLINPMARDPWGSVYPKSAFFQEDTSQEIIVDADVVHPRRPNRCGLSKTWILSIISFVYLAIIGALVVLLVLLPTHSSWYHVEAFDTFKNPMITRNSYANPFIPNETKSNAELLPISRVNSSEVNNIGFVDYTSGIPMRTNSHASNTNKKLPIRPSPIDPYLWDELGDKVIPRADINRSPFFESPTDQTTNSSSKLEDISAGTTVRSVETRLPSVVETSKKEPPTRINNRILRVK